ncbi:unnamed protein product, partial [Medioppia subpectinata]
MLPLIAVILTSIPTLIHSTDTSEFTQQNNRFAFNLLNVLPLNQNHFFSPLSISHSLYMLLNGANGRTETELKALFNIHTNETLQPMNENIKSTLHLINSKNSNDSVIRLANRVLISNIYNLTESYNSVMRDTFNASVDSVDFTQNADNITNNINDWIREQTNGKIDKLFDTLANDTRFVITNALYFSAVWDKPFDPYSTTDDDFYGINKTAKVLFMRQETKFRYTFDQQLNASLIELPFIHESNISMIIVFPNNTNGFNNTIEKLVSLSLNERLKNLYNSDKRQLKLRVPKFNLETSYDLKHPLRQLGLNTAFESSADLSGITGDRNVRVSEAIHKAVFKVTEVGAEASAAVGIVGVPHIWIPPLEVTINRPFVFIIRDNNTGIVLFVGQVFDV